MRSLMGVLQHLQARLRENGRPGAAAAAATVVVGLLFLMSSTLGRGFNNLSYDLPFLLRLPFHNPEPVREVAMVYMDDASHLALKQPWMMPWDRDVHAQLIEKMTQWGAKAVVFDVLFDMPGTNDHRLIEAARQNGRVVMGSVFIPHTYAGDIIGWKANPPFAELRNVVKWGVVEAAGSDRVVRQHFRGNFATPTLAWRVAEATLPPPLPDPFAPRWVNYYGPPGTLPYYSYVDVLSNNIPAITFSNKVVFVGALYAVGFTGGKGTDDFRTPYTRWYQTKSPGVEINATTYLNLTRGDALIELRPWIELLLVLGAGVALGFGLMLGRPIVATLAALAAFLVVTLAACLLVWRWGFWFPWMTIAGLQIPLALAWSLLTNTKKLYHQNKVLEERLATAVSDRPVPVPILAGHDPISPTLVVPAPPAPPPLSPPIPNHELLRCIGKGGYGEVWLARDEIGTYHAVKIIHLRSFQDAGPFHREFRGMQQFTPISRSHPGFVHILHVGRNLPDGYFFYIMELGDCEVNGQAIDVETYSAKNLRRELARRGPLPLGELLPMMVDLAGALHFLHTRNLIHRDIKPSNIIFVNGTPKFADIGLVTRIAEPGRDVTYLGTEGFIAPEGPGTPGADVYSFGKLLQEAAFAGDLPADSGRDELHPLRQIILRACHHDPAQRYQSAAELQADLQRLQERLGLPNRAPV